MSDPSFITLLTEDYIRIMKDEYQRPIYGAQADTLYEGISTLNYIMDAEELFKEMVPQLDSSEFYQVVVNGPPGSGKSTLARELAHHAHLVGYHPIYISGFDITKAPTTIARDVVGHNKVCIILDDLSYIMNAISAKSGSKIKSFAMLIRHYLKQANGGKEVNVMVIVIAHFTTAVPPVFKNSNVWLFSHPTMLEYDNMLKLVGRKQEARESLERIFASVINIQEKAGKKKDIILNMKGKKYTFRWGDKTDPGDGRLMLIMFNGTPKIYNSKNTFCPECQHIGFGVQVHEADYQMNRPSEEDAMQSEKRGTQ